MKGGVYFYLPSNMSSQQITTSGVSKIDIFIKIFQTIPKFHINCGRNLSGITFISVQVQWDPHMIFIF